MKATTHANDWSLILTLAFQFYLGTGEFYVGTGLGMPGCSYATGITVYTLSLLFGLFSIENKLQL